MTIFLNAKQVMDKLNVTRPTILKWEEKGILNPIRLDGGHRRYKQTEIEKITGEITVPAGNINCVIYGRVSTKNKRIAGIGTLSVAKVK